MDRPDIVKVRDLTTEKVSVVHTSRLRLFRHPAEMTPEELVGIDVDEYISIFCRKYYRSWRKRPERKELEV